MKIDMLTEKILIFQKEIFHTNIIVNHIIQAMHELNK